MKLSPVLADVGASGASHAVWHPIASESTLVGFEPDSRNPDKTFGAGFARAVLVDKAVTADNTADTVSFILTEYPSCSSTLEPDLHSLASFSFRDYFRPVGRTEVPATSLERVIVSQRLEAFHWLKLDTQGTDLKLLQSLSPRHLDHLLAVDIELGLIKAYIGEDMFTNCHDWLIEQGFWMSRLEYQAYPKIRPETLAELSHRIGADKSLVMRRLPKAPTAVEGRYMREITWLQARASGPEAFALAFVFGMLDGQLGYAYDVASAYAERFGDDAHAETMRRIVSDSLQ